MIYNIVDLVAYGSKKEGWEVDGAYYYHENLELKNTDAKNIVKGLKDVGFFHKFVRSNMVTIEEGFNRFTVYERSSGRPVSELRLISQ